MTDNRRFRMINSFTKRSVRLTRFVHGPLSFNKSKMELKRRPSECGSPYKNVIINFISGSLRLFFFLRYRGLRRTTLALLLPVPKGSLRLTLNIIIRIIYVLIYICVCVYLFIWVRCVGVYFIHEFLRRKRLRALRKWETAKTRCLRRVLYSIRVLSSRLHFRNFKFLIKTCIVLKARVLFDIHFVLETCVGGRNRE